VTSPSFSPMLARRGEARGDRWLFEPKWDGWRSLV
jgi:ATP-dependent DNA ligase